MAYSIFVVRMVKTLFIACIFLFFCNAAARADASADLYKAKCAACHGPDGAGSTVGLKLGAHDLRSADVQKMTDDDLMAVISKGKNKMPGYEKTLKPADIKGLVMFTRSFAGKK